MQGEVTRTEQSEEWHKAKIFSLTHIGLTLSGLIGIAVFIYGFGEQFGVLKADVGVLKNDVDLNQLEIRNIQAGQIARDTALSEKISQMRLEAKADNQQTRSEIGELRTALGEKLDRLIERQ
jgi:hypothetical protein